jgi:D-galactarolactone cycloisomerase
MPVHKLMGGAYRDRARAYATGLYEPQNVPSVIDALVDEARGYVEQGFAGMKLKVGYELDTDVAYVRAIREAIGPDVALMVDANHAYNAGEALALALAIAPYDVHWLEEPVVPEDLDGYAELRARSPVRIAGGECEYTRYGFRELIGRRAVDVLQPDLCAAGGFTELQRIIAMASAAHLPVIPHVWGTAVGLAAALQLFATLPHVPERRFPAEPWFEYDRSPHPFRDAVAHERFEMSNGYLAIPDRPGLGVTLDEEVLASFAAR